MASLINHLLEIVKDQSLRNISEQVATTKAALVVISWNGWQNPLPSIFPSPQCPIEPAPGSHYWHSSGSIQAPSLILCRSQTDSQYHPRHKLSPHLHGSFDSGNRWRAYAQGRGWGRWVADITSSPQDTCCAPRQCGSKCFKGKVISKASLSPASVVLMLFDVLPDGGFPMAPLLNYWE